MLGGPLERSGFPPPSGGFTPSRCGLFLLRRSHLSLQWAQISTSPCAEIFIPAQKAKQKKARRVPISSRLKAILEMRRFGPDGEDQPSNAFVFGNAVGERTGTTSIDWAWKKTVLQAHGHPGEPRTYDHAYRAINLHFHDLRREAGSRWLEGGVPLHKVRDWLGHSNIAQTSTYLAGTSGGDEDYMRRFEERAGRLQNIANPSGNEGIQRESEGVYSDARC